METWNAGLRWFSPMGEGERGERLDSGAGLKIDYQQNEH